MATQNITIATSENASFIQTLASEIFENHNREIGDAVIAKNFALSYMKEKAENIEVGGLDFAEPVMITENTNFGFRSHVSDIPGQIQDFIREFKFEPLSLTGAIPLNVKHELMNAGKAEIRKITKDLMMQAESTTSNIVNRGLWKASPTDGVDPESIRSIVSDTPTVGSIGGISRANSFAQNKVDTGTIASAGSAAGFAALNKFRIKLGGDAKTYPDFGVTTATIFSNIMAFMVNNRRLTADEKKVRYAIDTLEFSPGCTLGYDGDGGTGECPANHLYWLNSRHLFFKVLEGSYFKYTPFELRGMNITKTSLFYMFYNITTNLPSSLGVHTAITG